MSRTVLAFLVAPLWVPLLFFPFALFVMFPYPEQGGAVFTSVFICAIFTYGGVFLFGVPAFHVLRSRKLTAPWIAVALGFFVGAFVFLIFVVLFGLSLGSSFEDALASMITRAMWSTVIWMVATGSLGALVGITLWLIARPDLSQP